MVVPSNSAKNWEWGWLGTNETWFMIPQWKNQIGKKFHKFVAKKFFYGFYLLFLIQGIWCKGNVTKVLWATLTILTGSKKRKLISYPENSGWYGRNVNCKDVGHPEFNTIDTQMRILL